MVASPAAYAFTSPSRVFFADARSAIVARPSLWQQTQLCGQTGLSPACQPMMISILRGPRAERAAHDHDDALPDPGDACRAPGVGRDRIRAHPGRTRRTRWPRSHPHRHGLRLRARRWVPRKRYRLAISPHRRVIPSRDPRDLTQPARPTALLRVRPPPQPTRRLHRDQHQAPGAPVHRRGR